MHTYYKSGLGEGLLLSRRTKPFTPERPNPKNPLALRRPGGGELRRPGLARDAEVVLGRAIVGVTVVWVERLAALNH